MTLEAELAGRRVAVDTALFIYLIERHPRFGALVRGLFLSAAEGAFSLAASSLALLEVLVVPYREGRTELAESYERILTKGLHLVPLSLPVLRTAAMLRGRHSLGTADALHLASALEAGCSAFVTNDRGIPSLPGLRVLQLEDHTGG